MPDISIMVKDNGPLVVRGPVALQDGEGAGLAGDAEVIALCRCGHSANKPFCDGSHKAAAFESTVRADS